MASTSAAKMGLGQIAQATANLMLGRAIKLSTVGLQKHKCAQVRVKHNEYDEYLKKFFSKPYDFWTYDEKGTVKIGDIVLIRKMDEPLSRTVLHQIEKIVFMHGHIIDPVTNRRVVQYKFEDETMKEKELIEQVLQFEDKEDSSTDLIGFDVKLENAWERLKELKGKENGDNNPGSVQQ